MLWQIATFPTPLHHVFLSHCAEDRESLILPLYQRLQRQQVKVWIDQHDYPYGRPSRMALRDGLLSCRHVIFCVTASFLRQSRGWCAMELAWTELMQDNLVTAGGPNLVNVFLPLIFVKPSDLKMPRSIWQSTRDRAIFWNREQPRREWAVSQIVSFLQRERLQAERYRQFLRQNHGLRQHLLETGRFNRVCRFEPELNAG